MQSPNVQGFHNLYFPDPCSEKWSGMTQNECGRFCSKCEKTVYDFTDGNFEDFLELYKKENGQACIRLNADQVGEDPIKGFEKGWFSIHNFIKAAVISFITYLGIINQANGQSSSAKEKQVLVKDQNTDETPNVANEPKFNTNNDQFINVFPIKGRLVTTNISHRIVTYNYGKHLISLYVNNELKDTTYSKNGEFVFPIKLETTVGDKIRIEAKGYRRKMRRWKTKLSVKNQTFIVQENSDQEVMLPVKSKRKRRKRFFFFHRRILMGCPKFR